MTQYFLNSSFFDWVPTGRIDRAPILGTFSTDSDIAIYYVVLAVLAITLVGLYGVRRSRTGRALIALRDNERGAQAYALDATRLRLVAFAMSGAIAAVAGCLLCQHQQAYDPNLFGPFENLNVFTMVIVGGVASPAGAVLGALYFLGTQWFLPTDWQALASGIGVLLILLIIPDGFGGLLYRLRDRWLARVGSEARGRAAGARDRRARSGGGAHRGAGGRRPVKRWLESPHRQRAGPRARRAVHHQRPRRGRTATASASSFPTSATEFGLDLTGRAHPHRDRLAAARWRCRCRSPRSPIAPTVSASCGSARSAGRASRCMTGLAVDARAARRSPDRVRASARPCSTRRTTRCWPTTTTSTRGRDVFSAPPRRQCGRRVSRSDLRRIRRRTSTAGGCRSSFSPSRDSSSCCSRSRCASRSGARSSGRRWARRRKRCSPRSRRRRSPSRGGSSGRSRACVGSGTRCRSWPRR